MLVGIMGKMGSGKTLSMSILATYLHRLTSVPVFANYHLTDSTYISSLRELWDINTAVFCFDEIWLTMDSREWSNNVRMTRWINQTRKKGLIVLYTTQHIRQVEMRVRKATDVLIYTERKNNEVSLTFIDYQYMKIGRKYIIAQPEKFYPLYDTFEVLQPMKMGYGE